MAVVDDLNLAHRNNELQLRILPIDTIARAAATRSFSPSSCSAKVSIVVHSRFENRSRRKSGLT